MSLIEQLWIGALVFICAAMVSGLAVDIIRNRRTAREDKRRLAPMPKTWFYTKDLIIEEHVEHIEREIRRLTEELHFGGFR